MIISDELIKYLAELSKIELTDDEQTVMKEELNKLVEYMHLIDEVDTSSVDEEAFGELVNVFREDTVKPSLDRSDVLSAAVTKNEEAFIVPKTVE